MKVSPNFGRLVSDVLAGYTYAEIERACGISTTYLRKMRGGIVPTDRTIVKLCTGLGIEPDMLVEEAHKTRELEDPEMLLHTAGRVAGLTTPERLELLKHFRDLMGSKPK